jgi:NADH-quinone oxidoreductase subunit G
MPSPAPSPAPPQAIETLKIRIDGQDYDIPKLMPDWQGKLQPTTMLQACQHAGVQVPYYCYHPRLQVAGNCRICLIEFGTPMLGPDRKPILNEDGSARIARSVLPYEPGTPRGAIACATPITPGMELYPSSPATRQMREAVMEWLLINHPLDCPICDQAGECKLQEYSYDHGKAATEFAEIKVHKPKAVDLGPRIVLDDERCILCSRCIRFTRDLAGDDALGIVHRGSYSSIAAYPGRQFDNNYTLNTVDICPVGALTSKDFRFQMRVWFLKETRSICSSCGTGCNITMWSREGKIHRYTPRENDAVNKSWMCDYGRLNYRWIDRNDRLREVRIRRDGENRTATWTAALREISEHLRGTSQGTVALVASARQSTEELYLLMKLARQFGALIDAVPRADKGDSFLLSADRNPNTTGAQSLGIGRPKLGLQLPQIAEGIRAGRIRTLVVFGEDVTRHGFSPDLLDSLHRLIVSDILPSETTRRAHYLLPGCAHAEKRGTFVNVNGRLQRFWKAVEPPGDARPEWEFLQEMVSQVTGENAAASIEGLFNRMAREIPAFAGLDWAKLGNTGADVADLSWRE